MKTDKVSDPLKPADERPFTHRKLTIIAQDPSVTGDDGRIIRACAQVPWTPLKPGPQGARFHVIDYDVTQDSFARPFVMPDDKDLFVDAEDDQLRTDVAFHAQQVYAIAARTLATFEAALGRRLPWGFSGHQLHLVPHAFSEANAYYSPDDRALLFGYVPGPDSVVYTCLSHDVVAHETCHAVLDGLRKRFLEPGLPDQPAFHEGFADIVALLSVFSLKKVVAQCLGRTEDGRIERADVSTKALRASVLTGVGEQLGAVLTQGRGALRRSALEPPGPGWQTDPEFLEPHRRGEVLVAIVLDVLIDIWVRRLEPLLVGDGGRPNRTIDRARAAEEGAKAADQLLTMLIRGLDYLPPVDFEFGDLLDAVVLADQELVPDDDLGYRTALKARFERSGIIRPPGQAQDLQTGKFVPSYQGLNFAAMRTDADEVYRFIWQNAEQLGINPGYYTHVESVQPSLRVGVDGLIVAESVANYIQMLDLTAGELAKFSGAALPFEIDPTRPVQVFGGGTIVFDQFARAKLHINKPLEDWDRQVRRLQHLYEHGLFGTDGALGATYGTPRGQAFAMLHQSDGTASETW